MTKTVMLSLSLALGLALSGASCRSKQEPTSPADPSLTDPDARKKPKDPETKECPPGSTQSTENPDVCVTSPEPVKPDPTDDSQR